MQGLYSFSFRGIKKDWIYIEDESTERSAWAPISRNLLTVPGKPGAFLQSTTTNVRTIRQKIFYDGETREDLRKLEEELAEWLITEEPQELIFDDEPDRVYYALVDGSFDVSEFLEIGEGTITFIFPDPYKYSKEQELIFTEDNLFLTNEGTANADPIFEIEVLEPVTFAMIQNQLDEYMMIGKPQRVENEVVNTRTLILDERGNTLDTWSIPPVAGDGGVVSGKFNTDGAGITVPDYGTGPRWHGPALMKEVPLAQDFEVEAHLQLRTSAVGQTARIEIYLFDEDMQMLGKMAVLDDNQKIEPRKAEGRIGPFVGNYINYLISDRNYLYRWDYFFGMLRIRRIGNQFEFYVTRISTDNKHVYSLMKTYRDTANQYGRKLKYIEIHIGKWATTPTPYSAKFFSVSAYALTEQTADQTPYIAYPGDIITFDHSNNEILINGESRVDLKDFGAKYFKLHKGVNQLFALPSTSFTTRVKYKESYR